MSGRHPASDKKRRRLRSQGDVPSARDLSPVGRFLGLALVLSLGVPSLLRALIQLFQVLLADPSPTGLARAGGLLQGLVLWCLGVALLMGVCGALPGWAANRWLWAPARLGGQPFPGFRLDPGPVGRELAALLLALGGLYWLRGAAAELATWPDPLGAARAAASWLRSGFLVGGGAAVLLGVLLHVRARRSYEERIRMTDSERRREAEEDQGSQAAREFEHGITARLLSPSAPAPAPGSAGLTVMEKPGGGRS